MILLKKLQMASQSYMATKHGLLQQPAAKKVVKCKMLKIAGAIFIQYEKEPKKSNQTVKSYENYIGDAKNKNDAMNKVFEISIKSTMTSENDIVHKNNSVNRFIDFQVILNMKIK